MTKDALEPEGYAGPVAVFDAEECARILSGLRAEPGKPPAWFKGWAASSPAFHRVGSDPRLLELVRPALGDDIVLWGASLIVKAESDIHPFHTDVESMAPDGGFVTVWIGLENTDRSSGLKFVPGSHRYGITMQELNHRVGVTRDASTDETTLAAARQYDAAARILQPEVHDGEALVFDGRVWHGSHNQTKAVRTALLLQYARPDRPVRMPKTFSWPIAFHERKKPPVVVVSGTGQPAVNRIVAAPRRSKAVGNGVHLLPPARLGPDLASFPHFWGRTPVLTDIEGHSSILAPGGSPHPLHQHLEEEILVVVSGTAELHVADDAAGTVNAERVRMGAGDFAYYPARLFHTLSNAGDTPLLYTMLKWINAGKLPNRSAARRAFVKAGAAIGSAAPGIGAPLFEGRTRWLKRLQAHASTLAPGAGYAPHADRHDVAILLLSGSVETLGREVTAPALFYHPANTQHGIRATGTAPARYLAFELGGRPSPLAILAQLQQHRANRASGTAPRL
ncbi:cupin domain-containing protein [Devosia insulae]|uniref:cupin domain-containing protein n=1 Tax=Devosia insulae TaxID=408174 RepID=UPI00159F24A8|nr:cupin domain-containing protein [Devosia insulae]